MILPKAIFTFVLLTWIGGLAFSFYNIAQGRIEYLAYALGFNLWAYFGLRVTRNVIKELKKSVIERQKLTEVAEQ